MRVNTFGTVVEVSRTDPATFDLFERDLPTLKQGQVMARLETFALTSNNVTYAVFGEAMGYWNFFPAAVEDRGIVPVWGFAVVEASLHADIPVGTRLYGFWPFASHVLLEADNVSASGLDDAADCRQGNHPFYNRYLRWSADSPMGGTYEMVSSLRPLFTTAWALESFHKDHDFFGANSVIMTSASSKTALATASCFRDANRFGGAVIGMTSQANVAFVRATKLYTEVISYDDISELEHAPSTIIDFAGNPDTLKALHRHLDGVLKYSCQVGKTHAGTGMPDETLPGPKPVLFFAPEQVRVAAHAMGHTAFEAELAQRWEAFYALADQLYERHTIQSLGDAAEFFASMIEGKVNPSVIYAVSP